MSEPNPFDLLLDQFRVVIREEIAQALTKQRPPKLQFNTEETAFMLGEKESWLAERVRKGEVPYRRHGRFVFFTEQDIQQIIEDSAVPRTLK